MATKVEEYLKKFNKAKTLKGNYDALLKDAYKYGLPNMETINQKSEGSNKKSEIFDDTASLAVQKYANRLQSQLVPPGKEWAVLKAGSEIEDEAREEIDKALEEITKVVFNNLPHSNFSSAAHESFMDLAISTGVMMVEQGDGVYSKLRFRSVPSRELILDSNTKGEAKTVWREFEVEAERVPTLYPKAKIPADMEKIIKEKPEYKVKLIEGVINQEKTRDYAHVLIYKKNMMIDETIESSPYIVFREKKAPNETWGRGRVMDVLSTIKTVNRLAELDIRAADLNANGVWTVADDGVINPYTSKIRPGAMIPVDSNNTASPTIAPLPVATNFQVNMDRIERLQYRINETMLAAPFGNIEESPVRTATEMSIRQNDVAQTTMATFARIQAEFLEPLMQRIIFVLQEQGALPELKADGKEVAIKFTSPISRIQDTEDLQAITTFLEYSQALPPELVVGTMKVEEFAQHIADKLGIPKSLQRTKAEQDAAKQSMAQTELQYSQQMTQAQQPPM